MSRVDFERQWFPAHPLFLVEAYPLLGSHWVYQTAEENTKDYLERCEDVYNIYLAHKVCIREFIQRVVLGFRIFDWCVACYNARFADFESLTYEVEWLHSEPDTPLLSLVYKHLLLWPTPSTIHRERQRQQIQLEKLLEEVRPLREDVRREHHSKALHIAHDLKFNQLLSQVPYPYPIGKWRSAAAETRAHLSTLRKGTNRSRNGRPSCRR